VAGSCYSTPEIIYNFILSQGNTYAKVLESSPPNEMFKVSHRLTSWNALAQSLALVYSTQGTNEFCLSLHEW
jgi:hypothetical protein